MLCCHHTPLDEEQLPCCLPCQIRWRCKRLAQRKGYAAGFVSPMLAFVRDIFVLCFCNYLPFLEKIGFVHASTCMECRQHHFDSNFGLNWTILMFWFQHACNWIDVHQQLACNTHVCRKHVFTGLAASIHWRLAEERRQASLTMMCVCVLTHGAHIKEQHRLPPAPFTWFQLLLTTTIVDPRDVQVL